MSRQYDFQPGLDISGRPDATFEELVQAIFGIAPLPNIGGVIYGTATPDVTNNARFSRYVWLDSSTTPPTPKYYNTGTLAWAAVSVADGAVTAAKIADAAVTILDGSGNSDRIARAYNGAVDATKANYILRLDANGQYVEIASFASLFTAGIVPLTALSKTGAADGQVLQYKSSDGLISLRTFSPDDFAAGSIGLAKLAVGTNTYVLQMVGGVPTWVAADNVMAAGDIYLDKLGENSDGGTAAAALQVPQRNAANTATIWTTPIFSKEYTVDAAATVADGTFAHAHDLGTTPKLVQVTLLCVTGELGYAAGEEIDFPVIIIAGYNSGAQLVASARDSEYITVLINNTAGAAVRHKATGIYTAFTAANWRYRVRAWA